MTANPEAGWNFDHSYADLPPLFYTKLYPTSVRNPQWVIFNEALATSMGLDPEALKSDAGLAIFAGNHIPDKAIPLAQAYAGHQYGHFTLLGDGRAILLGEQLTPTGQRLDIQFKGSGRTPYSRGGDGRAALGPMLREYIISEAMHALGIPTTRSLAVVSTGESVWRETPLTGAVLTRVADSHIRVGTFEYAAAWGSLDDLRALAEYTIRRHYPELPTDKDRYLAFLYAVIERQAQLIASWQGVGFIHGVMNTDNMAISGETIDYGPCAFMNTYDPNTVFSSIDTLGRYAYGNQPTIAAWNLARFAECLLPLLHDAQAQAVKLAKEAMASFAKQYAAHWLWGMRKKLGLSNEEAEDESLILELLSCMQQAQADFTNTFRALSRASFGEAAFFSKPRVKAWLAQWEARRSRQDISREAAMTLMQSHNPSVIPRNHRVEEALEAAVKEGDLGVMEQLLAALSRPYAYEAAHEAYSVPPPPSACDYKTFCGT